MILYFLFIRDTCEVNYKEELEIWNIRMQLEYFWNLMFLTIECVIMYYK